MSSSTRPVSGACWACPGCGAVVDVAAGERTTTCIYCATPGVVPRAPDATVEEPRLVVPFVVGRDEALAAVKHWQKTRSVFADGRIKHASVETMRGVYVPAWLYGALARSSYNVDIGENYTETYTTTVNGKRVTRTRTKTEWRPLAGDHERYVTDVLVSASRGVPNDELERVEPFDLRGLRRFDGRVVVGWAMEEPSLRKSEGLAAARAEAVEAVRRMIGAFLPGDTHRGLQHDTRWEHESIDLVLVPLWVLAVRYDPAKAALRVLVNGTTKKVGGDTPWSKLKIGLAVGAVVAVLLALLLARALRVSP